MKSEPELWEHGREIMRTFIEKHLPDESQYFDIVWNAMSSRGLLGSFHPVRREELQNEVGFLPPVVEMVALPITIAVLSNILAAVILHKHFHKAAVIDQAEAERLLREFGKFREEQLQIVNRFVDFLEEHLPKSDDDHGDRQGCEE